MGLSRRLLADGEVVVYQARPHWVALGWPLLVFPVSVGGLAALAIGAPGTPLAVGDAIAGVAAASVLWLAVRAARWARTTLALTTLRLVERSGVLGRRGEEIRLDRVAAVSYRQSPLGVLWRSGQLVVDVGGGERVVVDHVRQPARLQALVAEQISSMAGAVAGWSPGAQLTARRSEDWARQTAPARFDEPTTPPAGTAAVATVARGAATVPPFGEVPAGPMGRSVVDRLAVLAELHRRGLVSDAEMERKRAQILDEL